MAVFSKDRPLQLDAALRSFATCCSDADVADIRVLYRASSERFGRGYDRLKRDHPGVTFVAESDFKADLLGIVSAGTHVLFLVDDTIFLGDCSLGSAVSALDSHPEILGVSYRLGRNTTYCYPLRRSQPVPPFAAIDSELVGFDWTSARDDFGYPLEVSSSLYRTQDLLPLVQELAFRNPNSLEQCLASVVDRFRRTRARLACYPRSVAVSVPLNIVQKVIPNRSGGRLSLSADALSSVFERGDRIDVVRYRGMSTNACHQELPLLLARDRTRPTVSVVIPCYGHAQFLPDAVASVVSQTYTDWELVIVDDGSPDATAAVAAELIHRYEGSRIRLISQANAGVSTARNRGIMESTGEFILPLDADDMIAPRFLSVTLDALGSHPDRAIAACDQISIGETRFRGLRPPFLPFLLPALNHLPYCALYRREVWDVVGGYNPNMRHGYEDWDFWVGAIEAGFRPLRVPEPLFVYRVHGTSRSTEAARHDRELRHQVRDNHPRLYTVPLRLARAPFVAGYMIPMRLMRAWGLKVRGRLRDR